MGRFWVIGGEYADARFEQLAPGARLERHGPFARYDEAHAVWQARARATIDDALIRFRIVEEEDGRRHPAA
jgi:NADPH-dependent curcumin reductase CurA